MVPPVQVICQESSIILVLCRFLPQILSQNLQVLQVTHLHWLISGGNITLVRGNHTLPRRYPLLAALRMRATGFSGAVRVLRNDAFISEVKQNFGIHNLNEMCFP